MSRLNTAMRLLKSNKKHFFIELLKQFSFFFPSMRFYLKVLYRLHTGMKLNLDSPKTFNEKIQWLKLYDRNPLYSSLVDKLAVKKYVATTIGEKYVVPTLGVWETFCAVDFNCLPNQFVLKTTNGGGGNVVVCRDKEKLNLKNASMLLKKSLKTSIYRRLGEWPYKNVPPRIIAEKYLEDESGELRDYKFFCFDGEVKCLQVDYDRFIEHHRNIYDSDWNLMPFSIGFQSKSGVVIEKPKNFDEMIKIARKLSKGFPHVRVDLYNVNGTIYFGELTFYHGSGFEEMIPGEWNYIWGEWLKLPERKGFV